VTQDLLDMIHLRKVGETPEDVIREYVALFCVPELDRDPPRRRLVGDALLNRFFGKDCLQPMHLPRRSETRAMLGTAQMVCLFDHAAWYDQFGLLDQSIPFEIRHLKPFINKFFGFRFENRFYTQHTLCMGFRPACEVGQSVTWCLVDFDSPNVDCATCIDNVLFALHIGAPKADLISAGRTFLERCESIGAVVNHREKSLEERMVSEFDWLGEHYDLNKKVRSLTQKSVNKARYCLALLDDILRSSHARKTTRLTRRRVAAIYGLAFFVASILDINLSPFYDAITRYRRIAAIEADWNDLAPAFTLAAAQQLQQWLRFADENNPIPIVNESAPIDYTIFTDASADRWGAVSFSKYGTVHLFDGDWSEHEKQTSNLQDSTVSEPLGMVHAICAIVSTTTKHIRIVTDHKGMVFAARAKYAKGKHYNDALLRIRRLFPELQISASFIPGKENILPDKREKGAIKAVVFREVRMKLTYEA